MRLADTSSETPGRAKPDSGATIESRGASAPTRGTACTPPPDPTRFPRTLAAPGRVKNQVQRGGCPSGCPLNGCRSTHARWLCNARSHARETSAKFSGVTVCAGPGRETQRGGHNPDSSYTRCGTHAWAMALCKSHPTCGKVLQSSPLTRVVNVVRLASKGGLSTEDTHQIPGSKPPQPRVRRVPSRFAWRPVCHGVHTARSSTHLSRGDDPHSPLPWSAWL